MKPFILDSAIVTMNWTLNEIYVMCRLIDIQQIVDTKKKKKHFAAREFDSFQSRPNQLIYWKIPWWACEINIDGHWWATISETKRKKFFNQKNGLEKFTWLGRKKKSLMSLLLDHQQISTLGLIRSEIKHNT